ncbi:germin 2-1 isoform X1 [Olea europaea subsp. europaea]|uniref:Germin 2-1 isoform X1 n=1 Tax=Olea europaea subsp. europaea TaxID=158383 RepID=A0A8S0QC65_OLEEU|nr:germin 2-1 isoform X1 [Olea europaea subsp. europaea]
MAVRILIAALLILFVSFAYAFDPDPLQDFCVAVKDDEAKVFVNGKICKDPNMVSADDFFFPGLNMPGNTSNPLGSKVTPVNVNQLPGLNTLGISLVRIDYAPYGLNPPHTHPRGTEVIVVVEGTLYVGFVTSNPADPNMKNKLFTKTLYPGDVFVFPEGLIHFQFNVGKTNAIVFAGLSSQNPGVITIANAVFGSDPPINLDVLTKAFQVDANVIKYLQGQFCRHFSFSTYQKLFSSTSLQIKLNTSLRNMHLSSLMARQVNIYASDPSPLQDFCVAVNDSNAAVFVNGKICKDPKMVTADDFYFSGFNKPGNTSNSVGSRVTQVTVNQLAGLNTLGTSLVRIDYAPQGLNPPHTHPRATEVLVVVEGTLYVGFVTSNPAHPNMKNKLFTKILHPGDVFVFPKGLIHFQFNVGKKKAVAFAGLSSQNPGVITIANAVFGSDPPISRDVLTMAFQVDKNVIKYLQSQF